MRMSFAFLLALVVGCRLPPDRDDLKLLDEGRPPIGYADTYLRARSQAGLALEAFYADAWADLDAAAKALEQTSRFLPLAKDIPANLAESLPRDAEELRKNAVALGEAARAKDVRAANGALQKLQFDLRSVRAVPEPATKQ